MGLPEQGPGAVAGYGRRLAALVVDWLVALLIAQSLSAACHWSPMSRSFATLAGFGLIAWLATGIFGTTLGKRIAGLRVAGPEDGRIGLFWAFERAVLLVIVVPAVIWDRDHRGLHDRAANTVVVVR
jgi:uncharacterized RDD family membrane protein YckC